MCDFVIERQKMETWKSFMAKRIDDMDNLHVEIENTQLVLV
jgi:hypothetical protein